MTSSTESGAGAGGGGAVALSPAESACLRVLAGHMIPPSAAYGVPGADDAAIFADMMTTVGRDREALSRTLARVDEAAGGRLSALPRATQAVLIARLRAAEPGLFAVVEAVVSRAYYRDDRVLRSLGLEPRPPFPKGYAVEEGDWSLLDPVRDRGPIHRDAG
ncbi:MAG: hypothetical protein F9K19_08760 [Rhizobiaceae bacterium]|nr:MAG: hypothetical protein F9K19_08760 [Rhizobiaceae bacterium]